MGVNITIALSMVWCACNVYISSIQFNLSIVSSWNEFSEMSKSHQHLIKFVAMLLQLFHIKYYIKLGIWGTALQKQCLYQLGLIGPIKSIGKILEWSVNQWRRFKKIGSNISLGELLSSRYHITASKVQWQKWLPQMPHMIGPWK